MATTLVGMVWRPGITGIKFIAVCVYRCVITLGLRSKYDVDAQYFRIVVQILEITSSMTLKI